MACCVQTTVLGAKVDTKLHCLVYECVEAWINIDALGPQELVESPLFIAPFAAMVCHMSSLIQVQV